MQKDIFLPETKTMKNVPTFLNSTFCHLFGYLLQSSILNSPVVNNFNQQKSTSASRIFSTQVGNREKFYHGNFFSKYLLKRKFYLSHSVISTLFKVRMKKIKKSL